jgi:hypothetical protein
MIKSTSRVAQFSVASLGTLVLVACGGGGGGGSAPPTAPATYSVIANVSGLSGSNLVLSLGNGTNVPVSGNGQVTLIAGLANGTSYSVTVTSAPINPSETCTLSSGSGTVDGSTVTVSVSCTTANTPQASTQMMADSSIPASTASSIMNIVTVAGSGALGSWVPINLSSALGDTIALGVDANGHVIVGAVVTSNQTIFTADSTALALVRLVIADVTTTMTGATLSTSIQGASGYGNLVSEISADLASGVRPLSDPAVVSSIVSIAITLAPDIAATPNRAKSKTVASTSQTITSSPFFVISKTNPKSGLHFGLGVSDNGPGSPTTTITNALAIPWSVQSQSLPLNGPPTNPMVLVQHFSSQPTIASYNSPYDLVLTQNSQTDEQIAVDIGSSAVAITAAGYNAALDESCVSNVVFAALDPIVAAKIKAGTLSLSDALSELPSSLTLDTSKGIFEKCAPLLVQQIGLSAALYYQVTVQALLDITSGWGVLGLMNAQLQVASYLMEMTEATQYAGQTFNDTVCTASDFTIHSCVGSFEFSPAMLLMAPGASALVAVTGHAVNSDNTIGPATPLPGDIEYTPLNSAVASVAGTVTSFTVTAASAGTTNVDALDPATGATNAPPALNANPFAVTVAMPTLVPSAIVFTVSTSDQTLTVSLAGPNGEPVCAIAPVEPCISLPDGITWQPTTATATITPVTTSGPMGTWTIPANAMPGTVSITATAGGVPYGPLTITVSNVTLEISPSAPTTVVGSTVTLTVSALDGSGNPIATPPNLTWASSNTSFATVNGGVVTGVAPGSPTITVTDPVSGATASVNVTVISNFNGTWTGYLNGTCVGGGSPLYTITFEGNAVYYYVPPQFQYDVVFSANGTVATFPGVLFWTLNGNSTMTLTNIVTPCQSGSVFTRQ